MTTQPVRGLAVSDGGLTLELARKTARPGQRFELAFRIARRDGATQRAFAVEHTRRMHLIVVRRDLTGFQHLHPRQLPDGSWTVPARLADAGAYRVFADFATGHDQPRTLAADLSVDGTTKSQALPDPEPTTTVDGLRVTLNPHAANATDPSELAFTVTRQDNGRAVTPDPYLGAKGHLVALREGDLAFLHVHPDEDRLRFTATFPTAGRYRLFLQFRAQGKLHTAAFTERVER